MPCSARPSPPGHRPVRPGGASCRPARARWPAPSPRGAGGGACGRAPSPAPRTPCVERRRTPARPPAARPTRLCVRRSYTLPQQRVASAAAPVLVAAVHLHHAAPNGRLVDEAGEACGRTVVVEREHAVALRDDVGLREPASERGRFGGRGRVPEPERGERLQVGGGVGAYAGRVRHEARGNAYHLTRPPPGPTEMHGNYRHARAGYARDTAPRRRRVRRWRQRRQVVARRLAHPLRGLHQRRQGARPTPR